MAQLVPLLDDANANVRALVREGLIKLADVASLAESVRTGALHMLMSGGPRGFEQAAMVLRPLKHQPAAERLLVLLGDEHEEVGIAAAWALRRLAVASTAERIFQRVRAATQNGQKKPPRSTMANFDPVGATFRQMEHLIEALGVNAISAGRRDAQSLLAGAAAGRLSAPR